MKRKTPHRAVLLLLASLLWALPGAALAQEQPALLPPGIKAELILAVTAYDETGKEPCSARPLLIRNPDGSLSDVASLDGLDEKNMAAGYLNGVEFLYVDQEGRRRTLRNLRLDKRLVTEKNGTRLGFDWIGKGQCEGGMPDERRASWHLGTVSPDGRMDLDPAPDAQARISLQEHSRRAAFEYFAGLFAKYGQTPQEPLGKGMSHEAPAFGDLDGDGLGDIAQVWWCATRNAQGKNPLRWCSISPSVLVVAFGNGKSAAYIPKPQWEPECSGLQSSWMMRLHDGRPVVLAVSLGVPHVADMVDFSSGTPVRVARFGKHEKRMKR